MEIYSIQWITMQQHFRWTNFYFIWGSIWWLSQCRSRLIGVVGDLFFNSLICVQMTWNCFQMLPGIPFFFTKFWFCIIGVFVVVGASWTHSLVCDNMWIWQCGNFGNFQSWQSGGNWSFNSLVLVQMSFDSHCIYKRHPSMK